MDDVTLLHTHQQRLPYLERIQEFIKNIISWQRLLRITGGDLSPEKSNVYIISYKFDSTGAPSMCSIAETPGDIVYYTDEGHRCKIERKEVDLGIRNLGIRLAPSGQWDTEYTYRLSDMRTFCGRLSRAPFDHNDAEIVYSCRYSPISKFCLPLAYFTEEQCNDYMKIVR